MINIRQTTNYRLAYTYSMTKIKTILYLHM